MNIVYTIRNRVNNKVYVGITTRSFKQRKAEHLSRLNTGSRDHKLYLAMKKHGIENFEFQEHFVCFNEEDLKYFEQLFIAEFNSYNRGYNMTIGGDMVSKETREKLSEIFTGRKITWYDKIIMSRANNKNDARQKTYQVLNSFGQIMEIHNLTAFCRENNLCPSNLHNRSKVNKFSKGYLILESSTTRA